MLDEEDREAGNEYGPWAWIGGYALAAVLMILMFTLSAGRF